MKRCLSILAGASIASRSGLEVNLAPNVVPTGDPSLSANSLKALYLSLRTALAGGILAKCLSVLALLAGFSCQSVLAQDGTTHIKLPVQAVTANPSTMGNPSTPPRRIQPGSLLFRLPPLIPDLTQPSGHMSQFRPNELPAGNEPQFVVKNGAAYIYVPGPAELIDIPIDITGGKLITIPTEISGFLIPVAGGGKSGCLGRDSDGSYDKVTMAPESPPVQHDH
jgi:hypothetical protein